MKQLKGKSTKLKRLQIGGYRQETPISNPQIPQATGWTQPSWTQKMALDYYSQHPKPLASGRADYVPIEQAFLPAAKGLGYLGDMAADFATGSMKSNAEKSLAEQVGHNANLDLATTAKLKSKFNTGNIDQDWHDWVNSSRTSAIHGPQAQETNAMLHGEGDMQRQAATQGPVKGIEQWGQNDDGSTKKWFMHYMNETPRTPLRKTQEASLKEPVKAIDMYQYLSPHQTGGNIKTDPNGYWDPRNYGKPIRIPSGDISMQGVPFPVQGVDNHQNQKLMMPGMNYKFPGKSVIEYPVNPYIERERGMTNIGVSGKAGNFNPYLNMNISSEEGKNYYEPSVGLSYSKEFAQGGPSPTKAHEMLHDGTAHGKPLTPAQKRYFGMIYGNSKHQMGGVGDHLIVPNIMQNGGYPIPYDMQQDKFQESLYPMQAGGPTRQDSLDLRNNALKVKSFYENEGYKQEFQRAGNSSDPTTYNQEGRDHFTNGYSIPFTKGADGIYNQVVLPASSQHNNYFASNPYYTNINDSQYLQREHQNSILNMNAPMSMYDRRIKPQYINGYSKELGPSDNKMLDEVNMSAYDPLAVTPYDMLNKQEIKDRLQKYGTSGFPPTRSSNSIIQPSDNKQSQTFSKQPSEKYFLPSGDRYMNYQELINTYPGMKDPKEYEKAFGKKPPMNLGGVNNTAISYNMSYGGTPCLECGGQMQEGGNTTNSNFPDDIPSQTKNNFVNWLKQTSFQKIHQEMLENPMNYSKEEQAQMKKGGGFNLNPAHKGFCTPMTKSTCTGKRRQFAINAKNHFKKQQLGGSQDLSQELAFNPNKYTNQMPDAGITYQPDTPQDIFNREYRGLKERASVVNQQYPGTVNILEPHHIDPGGGIPAPPPQEKQPRDWNPDIIMAGMDAVTNLINIPERQRQEAWLRKQTSSDRWNPLQRGSHGDYTVNNGYFKPDQMTPVQYAGNAGFYQDGGQYQDGSEVYMDDNEIQQFLQAGGELEYIDE